MMPLCILLSQQARVASFVLLKNTAKKFFCKMITFVLLVICLSWYAVFWYRRRRMYELAAQFSSISEELPLIGVAGSFGGTTEDIMTTFQRFSVAAMGLDGWLRVWMGPRLFLICTNPLDLEVVLKTCMEKDESLRFFTHLIGKGIVGSPVPIWRRRRRILVPAFGPKIMENFTEVFSMQSQTLIKKLESVAGSGEFSMWPYLTTFTLDTLCETAMGVNINSQNNPNSLFLNHMNELLNLFCERIFQVWLHPDWLYSLLPRSKTYFAAISGLHAFTDEVIQKKREELSMIEKHQKPESQTHIDLPNTNQRTTFLDLLISYSGGEKGYTNLELREEMLTLAIAAVDTSAHTIGYTLKLLAMYPKAQDKVYQELLDVFGDSNRPIEKEDYPKMQYLERVVKESLRLYPPLASIIRKVEKEITLPSGKTIPSQTGISISIWGLHRDPAYWGPDADHFDPDRFLPERFKLKHSCSYMPFSSGPRNCVGYQYALLSIKTVLSDILRKYKVVTDEKPSGPAPFIRVKLEVMMKAVDGYKIGLERRKK